MDSMLLYCFCSWYYVGIISLLLLVLYFHARGIFEVSETKLRNHHKVNVSIAPRDGTRHPLLHVRLKRYRWVAGNIRNYWFTRILTNYQVLLVWRCSGGLWIQLNGSNHNTNNCILKKVLKTVYYGNNTNGKSCLYVLYRRSSCLRILKQFGRTNNVLNEVIWNPLQAHR